MPRKPKQAAPRKTRYLVTVQRAGPRHVAMLSVLAAAENPEPAIAEAVKAAANQQQLDWMLAEQDKLIVTSYAPVPGPR